MKRADANASALFGGVVSVWPDSEPTLASPFGRGGTAKAVTERALGLCKPYGRTLNRLFHRDGFLLRRTSLRR